MSPRCRGAGTGAVLGLCKGQVLFPSFPLPPHTHAGASVRPQEIGDLNIPALRPGRDEVSISPVLGACAAELCLAPDFGGGCSLGLQLASRVKIWFCSLRSFLSLNPLS